MSLRNEINNKKLLRWSILLLVLGVPLTFFSLGIYGSFLFTFSVPLFWQVVICNKSITLLGLNKNLIKPSIFAGLISGCVLALSGGSVLTFFGILGNKFTNLHNLRCSFGGYTITLPLQKELGYRLLMRSDSLLDLALYLIFCIFVIGLGEELFWRGFIQRKISRYLSMNLSIWLAALFFTLIHFYLFKILSVKASFVFLTIIAIASITWGYLFERFNNIWGPAVSHGVTAFIIWKYYFFSGYGK